MSAVLPWLLLFSLALHAGAHLALVVRLGLRVKTEGPSAIGRALAALVVSPLAPLWSWPLGMRKTTIAWCVGLALYALCVAAA
ncbi:MAG: hypothetical protein JST00_32400 [Deltaproteobacteria bacterium]|nr:hypothetical protein [Deltaproteobacteria bacterium]